MEKQDNLTRQQEKDHITATLINTMKLKHTCRCTVLYLCQKNTCLRNEANQAFRSVVLIILLTQVKYDNDAVEASIIIFPLSTSAQACVLLLNYC